MKFELEELEMKKDIKEAKKRQKDRMKVLKEDVFYNFDKDCQNSLLMHTHHISKQVDYWLKNAMEAYDCGERQLGKDCINKCRGMLGLD